MRLVVCIVVLITAYVVSCAFIETNSSSASNHPKVAEAIQTFNLDPVNKHSNWGFFAQSVDNGSLIGSFNSDKSLTPASTLKVVSTMAALDILGDDYIYTTTLAYDGSIANGALNGNIYIIGGGDPTLGTPRKDIATYYKALLNKWIAAVQALGIYKINGRIIGDARFFSEEMTPSEWIWEDMGNYYGAGSSGLSFHENRYDIIFDSGASEGKSTRLVNVIPEVPGVEFINRVKAGPAGSGDRAYIYGAPYSNIYHVRGTIPPSKSGFPVRGAVPDPAVFAATCLHNALKKAGISISEKATSIRHLKLAKKMPKTTPKTFHTHNSPPLKDIVYWTNKRSINIFAEHILRTLGKSKYKVASIDNGLKAVKNYWKNKNVDIGSLIMHDGSGLSPSNAISPKTLTNMLIHYRYNRGYQAFYHSLPVAGNANDKGHLKSFMKGSGNKMHVKSGYIGNNRCYTGYIETQTQGLVAFTIMVNHYTCGNGTMKKKIEQLLRSVTSL